MKAAVVTAPCKMEILDVCKPEISSGDEIIIKVEAASLCNTTDYKIYSAVDPKSVWPYLPHPYILGHECSGKIVDAGESVKGFRKGERIVLWPISGGAFAEYVKISSGNAVIGKINDEVPKHIATLMEMVICTARLMYRSDGSQIIKKGNTVVIYGLGPSGLVYINLAKLMGAGTVIAVGNRKFRLDKAKEMGADIVIDKNEQRASAKIKEMNFKPDVFIDATGSDIFDEIIHLSKPGMALIPYGVPPFKWKEKIPKLTARNIRFCAGGLNEARIAIKHCISWIESGRLNLEPLITHIIPLDEVESGLKLCHDHRDETLKVVIRLP
jgi:L-iditol 2-dehydrogenase